MKQQTFETFCPLFPGFYGTVFEYDGEENDIEYYNEENKTDLNFDDFNFDYADYHKRVSKAFVNKLESELKYWLPDINIEFQELYSPKEYNFTNDSINVSVQVDLNELLGLIQARKEDAAKYFKEKYTSRSGFISFHSANIDNWLNLDYIMEDSKHRVGALLDCLCSIEISEDDIIYWADSESWIDFCPKTEVETNCITK